MRIWIVLFCLWSTVGYADASTLYTLGGGSQDLYNIDLTNGNHFIVNSSPLGGIPVFIALANDQTGYVVNKTNEVLRVGLTSGTVSIASTFPGGAKLNGIALANPRTAYVVRQLSDNFYRVDLTNGNFSSVTSSGLGGAGAFGVSLELSVKNPKTAYSVGNNDNNVYRIDLTNGNVFVVTPSPITGSGLSDLALANNGTAYVVGFSDSNVYRVDLTNGNVSLVTPLPVPGSNLTGIALTNSTTAYVVNSGGNNVHRVDLTTGNTYFVTAIAFAGLSGAAPVLQIGTAGLHGNDLTLANYLNENGSLFDLRLFALQGDIAGALEIAAPTRNAISTFTAGNTQLTFEQVLSNHLCQKRLILAPRNSSAITDAEGLMADAEATPSLPPSLKPKTLYSPWLSPFGEFTHGRPEHETPAFESETGGVVTGVDWLLRDSVRPLLGVAMAYGYTHVHEKQSAGHANINQGAAGFYTELEVAEWWFDLGLWGGMYHTDNVRNVNLPGVAGGSAKASINGWQLSPHLELGCDFDQNWLRIEPFEMMDWVVSWERGFHEHGAGILNMGQDGRTSALLRNEIGIRLIETIFYGWGTLSLREKASYGYQKAFNVGTITAFLLGSPGSFTVTTLRNAESLGVFEFEALFVPGNKKYPYGSIRCQGEVGERYQSRQAIASLGLEF
jgi:uncharacterized protein with beta-barrel porin domain